MIETNIISNAPVEVESVGVELLPVEISLVDSCVAEVLRL